MQLGKLQEIESEITDLGYQIIAVNADQANLVAPFAEEKKYSYHLYADPDLDAAEAFGIAFRASDEMYEALIGYGIDIEQRSGRDHHKLPVPSVFITDETGKITFTYVNPVYQQRIAPALLMAALKASAEEK